MTIHIGFLVFPKIQQLDLTGPYEVFASLPDTAVHLVARSLDPLTSSSGLVFHPTVTLEQCPKLDVFCVPGGAGVNALLQDEEILAFVRVQAATVRYMTSVCTGALVLGAAGLLQGRRATTHWAAQDQLPHFGAVPVDTRVVRDGNLFTGGGVTAGIDFALTVAAELMGDVAAQTVQLGLEYAPAPPFDAGRCETASPEVVAAARQAASASRREREAIISALRPAKTSG